MSGITALLRPRYACRRQIRIQEFLRFPVETASLQFARVLKIMHTVGAQGHTRKWIYHCSKGCSRLMGLQSTSSPDSSQDFHEGIAQERRTGDHKKPGIAKFGLTDSQPPE